MHDGWMWVDEGVGGLMDGGIDERMDGWKGGYGWMSGWVHGRVNGWVWGACKHILGCPVILRPEMV